MAAEILIPFGAADICHISVGSNDCQKRREIFSVMWNEIALCHRHFIENLDRVLKFIMQIKIWLGAKVLLLAREYGNFF